MLLVEKHIINKNNQLYQECDHLSFLSKNLYNFALYQWRQEFINNNKYLSFVDLYYHCRHKHDYSQLPDKVSKGTLRQLSSNISSTWKAIKSYKKNPSKFKARPQLPKYKHKTKGRFTVNYEKLAINKRTYKKTGKIKLSKTNIEIYTKIPLEQIKCVRITRSDNYSYCIDVVYENLIHERVKPSHKNKSVKVAAIDFGLNNLMSVVYSDGSQPTLISGKPLKSINQYFNKKKANLQSKLDEGKYNSNKISKLTHKRNNKVKDYLHKSSKKIVNQLVSRGVSTLILGRNKGMKQDINLGKRNNQNFVYIPLYKLIQQIHYKCVLEGIKVIEQEESYTSKCSFLDYEEVKKQEIYKGRRIKRGMFLTANKLKINADINAGYNIMTKAVLNDSNDLEFDKIEVLCQRNLAAVTPVLIIPHR